MKFKSVLLFCLAVGLVSGAMACVTEATGTDDGSGSLNPQPLPPAAPDQDGKEATDTTGSPNAGSSTSGSSSSGSSPTTPPPADAGTD